MLKLRHGQPGIGSAEQTEGTGPWSRRAEKAAEGFRNFGFIRGFAFTAYRVEASGFAFSSFSLARRGLLIRAAGRVSSRRAGFCSPAAAEIRPPREHNCAAQNCRQCSLLEVLTTLDSDSLSKSVPRLIFSPGRATSASPAQAVKSSANAQAMCLRQVSWLRGYGRPLVRDLSGTPVCRTINTTCGVWWREFCHG